MDFDTLLNHYFDGDDLEALSAEQLDRGLEALKIDFGIERESGRRFALWALLHMLGAAPDPNDAFEKSSERDAAHRFAAMANN